MFASCTVRSGHRTRTWRRPRATAASGWWGGGDLADAGLLDELWVQYAPVTLGAGSPLLPRHVELRLEDVLRNREFACVRYTVLR